MRFPLRRSVIVAITLFVLIWIALFAMTMRQPPELTFSGDAFAYSRGGLLIAEQGFYSQDGVQPILEREPGQSLWLATVYTIARGESRAAAFLAQGLLYLIASLIFTRELRRSFGARVADFTLFFLLLLPPAFHVIFSVIRETLTLSMFMLLTASLLALLRAPRWATAIGGGIAFGFVILGYIPYMLYPIWVIALFWFFPLPKKFLFPVIGIPLLMLSLWGARNAAYTGRPCLTGCYRSAVQWYVRGERAETLRGLEPLKCLWSEYVSRDWTGRSPNCSFVAVQHRGWPEGFTEDERSAQLGIQGRHKILRYFPWYLWDSVFEIIELNLPYVNGWGLPYNAAAALATVILDAGTLLALLSFRRIWRRELLPLILPVLYTTGIFILTDATPRYLVPVLFSYCAVAAIGYDRWLRRRTG